MESSESTEMSVQSNGEDSSPATTKQAIWALAGGKGGVGRSLLAANLGVHLAHAGCRVVLVDLDLQGSNLHTYLGYHRLPRTLSDLASGAVKVLSELAFETPTSHLRYIGGLQRGELCSEPLGFVRNVVDQLSTLSADHILVDCGSGRSPATVAAFSEASIGILVTTPEPAALESLYMFTEAYLRSCLTRALTDGELSTIEALLRENGLDPGRLSFRSFMTRLTTIDASAREKIAAFLRRTRLELLMNQVRGDSDQDTIASLVSGFRKCFGLPLHPVGSIEHDLSVLQAVQKRRPLSQQDPNAAVTRGISHTARSLLNLPPTPPLDPREEWEDIESLDHYRLLEVMPGATPKEVQSAYQLLRRTYDPETTCLSPLLEASGLREIQERIESAYKTLIFLESRADYDRQMAESCTLKADASIDRADEEEPPAVKGDQTELEGPPLELAGGETTLAGVEREPGEVPSAAAGDPVSDPESDRGDPSSTPTSGETLRATRERIGMTLEMIGETTKIRSHHLKAIEEERFGDLPAAVFVRGFLREYARSLGVPHDDIITQYMKRYQDWHESRTNPDTSRSRR